MDAETRWKAKIGLFAVLTGLLAVVAVGVLSNVNLFEGERIRYRIVFDESVAGIEVSSPVRYVGLPVGEVVALGVDPETSLPLVRVAIDADLTLLTNVRATVTSQGITGLRYVELARVELPEDEVAREIDRDGTGRIPTHPSLFREAESMVAEGERLITRARRTLASVEAFVAPGGGEDGLRSLVADVRRTSRSVREGVDRTVGGVDETLAEGRATIRRLDETAEEVTRTARELREATATVHGIVEEVPVVETGEEVRALVGDLRSTTAELREVLERVDGTVARVDGLLRTHDRDLADVVEHVRRAARDLAEAATLVRDRPSVLLRDRARAERELP